MQAASAVNKAKSIKGKMSKGLDDATTRKRSKSTTEKDDGDIESGKRERKATITAKSSEGKSSSKKESASKAAAAKPAAEKEGSIGQVENIVYVFVARDNEMTVYS